MGRNLGLALALSLIACAGSKSAEESPASGSTKLEPTRDDNAKDTAVESTTGAPPPPSDFSPKGGGDTAAAPAETMANESKKTESKPVDAKELGKSNAALGTTDHGELFDQLAVKIASAKLGTKASTDLETAMATKTTELDACYATARKTTANLKGTIVLVFNVEPDGTVSSVTVKTSSKNKALDACVKDAAKLLKLDKPLVTTKTKATVEIAFGS